MYRLGVWALRLACRAGRPNPPLMALLVVGRSAQTLDRASEATAACEEALALARALGAVENEADALWRLAQLAVQEGRRGRTVELLTPAGATVAQAILGLLSADRPAFSPRAAGGRSPHCR